MLGKDSSRAGASSGCRVRRDLAREGSGMRTRRGKMSLLNAAMQGARRMATKVRAIRMLCIDLFRERVLVELERLR